MNSLSSEKVITFSDGVFDTMQACDKFDVTIEPVAGSASKHRVSVILVNTVKYSVRNSYTVSILATVRVVVVIARCLTVNQCYAQYTPPTPTRLKCLVESRRQC